MKKLFFALTACTVLFVACDDSSSSPSSENNSSVKSNSCSNADEPLTDPRDGKVYKTVKIGNQVWMAENLNYDVEGSWTNDSLDKDGSIYGRFYTFGRAKKACPDGWHLPTFDEIDELRENTGGVGLAGKNLKATSGWDKDEEGKDGNGTDKYCFGIKASGKSQNKEDGVYGVGKYAQLWTSTTFIRPEYDSYGNRIDRGSKVYYFSFTSSDSVYIESYDTTPAWNIRCLKGDSEPEPIAPENSSGYDDGAFTSKSD
ncbi:MULTISPECIES: FISUMP domain-containing protein [unclassified Fibrobacter]|uniref:FISUMP domain-containing protein n=1 Tax=unclassified Fibrobacter TaxID=2634177 RepID=UPI0025BB413E|nr:MULTISPECIES: FISUMP domain-containing protein [unclassified Fibrobacter]